jgi:endogenous inhibitor of DNA gyrase (YacG/DUF329 family)
MKVKCDICNKETSDGLIIDNVYYCSIHCALQDFTEKELDDLKINGDLALFNWGG